jgi:hypothetical protein
LIFVTNFLFTTLDNFFTTYQFLRHWRLTVGALPTMLNPCPWPYIEANESNCFPDSHLISPGP